ncbi:MAG: hypothetical protein H6696_21000 [Deferribacteres bacterium]|nr:hypothetical protein [candidate division KSB1 bacterium]MCB9504412.1 hypothetical protein [Deferribacteres bacterium]
MSKYPQIDLHQIKRYSISDRHSKVNKELLGQSYSVGHSFKSFFKTLPDILVAKDLKEFVEHVAQAIVKKKPVMLMMGAHSIKVGLSPMLIDLIREGIITSISMNGAGVIHDTELALFGQTSEDVAKALADGSFGMVQETGMLVNRFIIEAHESGLGLGEGVGKAILEKSRDNLQRSVLANAYVHNVPATIHVAVGTDIIHQHPEADGAALGATSHRDFKIFAAHAASLNEGGIVMNVGSNVILPEVFLKALTVARNTKPPVNNFYTANFDMIQHYRPRVNVVQRPTLQGGKGYTFIGHHEIMLPLFFAAVKERLAELRSS